MKALLLVLFVACNWQTPHVPAGYRTCGNDTQCDDDEYCGFVEVDTYAVCKVDPNK